MACRMAKLEEETSAPDERFGIMLSSEHDRYGHEIDLAPAIRDSSRSSLSLRGCTQLADALYIDPVLQ